MNVLVTGANGFAGRNLCAALRERTDAAVDEYDLGNSTEELDAALARADVVFHLAGVNRPERVDEFAAGNAGFTGEILRKLRALGRSSKVVLSSSIHAESDSPYGASKRAAEDELRRYCDDTGAEGMVYRLKNLFGKWSRPNYNSVVATFCHNIARALPVEVSDPAHVIELTYIDVVVAAFLSELGAPAEHGCRFASPLPARAITLGELADTIRSFRAHRETLRLPDFSDPFIRALYATYLSFLPPEMLEYGLAVNTDARGSLAEFLKSPHFGQVFVSRTAPGITRGNHYHHTKVEKFLIVEGEGAIRLRPISGGAVTEFRVRGGEYRVVDIPPGYTHSIENVGVGEMVILFWSDEVFDPERPDTRFDPVLQEVHLETVG